MLDGASRQLSILTVNSSLGPVGGRTPYHSPPLPVRKRKQSSVGAAGDTLADEDEDVQIHVFVDHSCIEVFLNERIAITARAYPVGDDSEEVRLWSSGADATVSVASWRLSADVV